ncbi:MAG: SGNH/GDSL hydrolase family protein [Paracoccaceae bacterium]|nr:SGNH/GDSL hydrolase family protein [Paracoccaceae bacterium]
MVRARLRAAALSPVLAFQAMKVISKTPRLPEPEGPRVGRVGSGPDLRVLIVGDSSAAGVGADHQLEALSGRLTHALAANFSVSWQLVAKTGMTTRKMPGYLKKNAQLRFDIAVTALGVNDVTRLVAPMTWVAQTNAFHQVLENDFGVRRIYVTAVPPMAKFPSIPDPLAGFLGDRASLMNAAQQRGLDTHGSARLVDPDWGFDDTMMASDRFHPGPRLYARWGSAMARHILNDLPDGGLGRS